MCLDPKDLNEALKRPHFQIPVLDDIASELGNARVFSTFDTKNGYW